MDELLPDRPAGLRDDFDERIALVFGKPDDPMAAVDQRAHLAFPENEPVVWEGDATNFAFTYVGRPAERILGYPVAHWLRPGFWADVVVHPEDRSEAVAYCALATGRGRDHEFEYRARTAGGDLVWFYDVVRVIIGAKAVPVRLRGVMFDITSEKVQAGLHHAAPERRHPLNP